MPNIVSDELFNGFLPLFLKQTFFSHDLELIHESVYIFNQNIIACNQHLFLLLIWDFFLRLGNLFVRLQCLNFMGLLFCWMGLVCISCCWSTRGVVVASLSLILLCIHFLIGLIIISLESSVWCRLDLSWARSILWGVDCSILVHLFILLVWCWWQFHFVS